MEIAGISDEKGVLEILDDIIKSINARVGNDYSAGILKHYKTKRERLAEFFKNKFKKSDFTLSMVDYNFLNLVAICMKIKYILKQSAGITCLKNQKKDFDLGHCFESDFRSHQN